MAGAARRPGFAPSRLAPWPLLAALAILFGLLCLRVWGLGVTHAYDAMWVLREI